MSKKRILYVGETTTNLTGFGTYGKEVMSRLHATGKYELAELASYGFVGDAEKDFIKWKYYANAVSKNDPRFKEYDQQKINQWGAWRFDRVLLDFKPDIVFDIRDFWMFSYQRLSPLRPFFHWAIMPTVDSAPQKEEWIDTFISADGVLTYSDWAVEVLRKEGGGNIKLFSSAPPGNDLSLYRPVVNKAEHKKILGLNREPIIIGTVMRNQPRKLFPDLFKAFRQLLDRLHNEGNSDLAGRIFLYCHTGFPDVAWDIPRLLIENGVQNKTLFSYKCRKCGSGFSAFFRGERAICPFCNKYSLMLPDISVGYDDVEKTQVYNLFDVYIQYSVAEGFGMPQVEAASCGVPVMSVDYSAMSDIVRKLRGVPIKVERMYRSYGEDAYRAYPDNEHLVDELYKFVKLPNSIRRQKGFEARKQAEKYYNWDNTAKIWEDYFDSVELTGLQGKWDSPYRKFGMPTNIPERVNNYDLLNWMLLNSIGPYFQDTYFLSELVDNLNYGANVDGMNKAKFDRKEAINLIEKLVNRHIQCEDVRCGKIQLEDEDYLKCARSK